MVQLSQSQFNKAQEFVLTQGRPLEQALWRFYFEEEPAAGVWQALTKFQNDDGGFGHALEPDLRAPASSALATQTALHILHSVHTPVDHPLVQGAFRFLIDTFDPQTNVWRFIPPSAGDFPHAPWWDQTRLSETFGGFLINPRANILGYLLWADLPQAEPIVRAIYLDVMTRFYETDKAIDNNTVFCYLNLIDHLPTEEKAKATDHLLQLAHLSLQTDPNEWHTYCLKPLDLVSGPEGPFYSTFEVLIHAHLDFEIGRQTSRGSWEPTWSWYGNFPETWPEAQKDWEGEITVNMMRKLQRFGRIVD